MSPGRSPHWVTSGWGYNVQRQDTLMRAIARIGSLQGTRRYVWRGVPDATWRVQSSLWRHLEQHAKTPAPFTEQAARAAEVDILRRARRWGLGLNGAGHLPDLQVLASLQHHGLPTRLLDVTANPYTALWFACDDPKHLSAAGVLLAFDVTDIPSEQTIPLIDSPTNGTVMDPTGWRLSYALEQSAQERRPFLVEPTVRDARMTAQEGLFITSAFLDDLDPKTGLDGFAVTDRPAPGAARFDALFAPTERGRGTPGQLPFCALVIPPKVKASVRRHLAGTYARDLRRLFPDVDGFARDLERHPTVVTPDPAAAASPAETTETPRPPDADPD